MADARQTTPQQKNRSAKILSSHSERLYRLAVGRAAGHGRRALRLRIRVDPAAVHPAIEGVGRLGIDVSLAHEAAKGRLDVTGWTAEPVVKIEMAKRGIKIIAPKQAYHSSPQPKAFRVGGRPSQELLGLGKLVDFHLGFLGVAGRR